MKSKLAAGVALLSLLMPLANGAAASPPDSVWIHAPVKVSAVGNATIGTLDGASGALEAYVRSELAKRRFIPAMIDGQAREAESLLTVLVSVKPRGDDYDVRIEQAYLSPGTKRVRPPRYPARMFESHKTGYSEIRVAIAPDGNVERIVSASATEPAFEQSARDALRDARFEPVRVDGKPISSEASVQFFFKIEREPLPDFKPSCRVDIRQPIIEGQNGCIAPIEVSASRRK